MTFRVIPFEPEHFEQLQVQKAQKYFSDYVQNYANYGKILKETGLAFTGITDEGIVGCSGVVYRNPKVVEAWAVLSILFPKYSFQATKAILKFLKEHQELHRVQIAVNLEFQQGHRWAQMLGFTPEGIMKKYDEFGNDHMLYAKVSEDLI